MTVSLLNYMDLIIVSLIFVLALKGIFSGFTRELISLIAIVGAVVVASRVAVPLAHWTQSHLFRLKNPAMTELLAFLLILLSVWGFVTLLGRLVERREAAGPTALSRALGFLLAGIKYFLIFAIIVSALFRTTLVREKLATQRRSSSLYPVLAKTGALLINLPAPILESNRIQTPKKKAAPVKVPPSH